VDDFCYDGTCSGLGTNSVTNIYFLLTDAAIQCPDSQDYYPSGTDVVEAFWNIPKPYYQGVDVIVASSKESGDVFSVGVTTVTYGARSQSPLGTASVRCSFNVTVHGIILKAGFWVSDSLDPCDSLTCNTRPSECFSAAGECVSGQCVYEPVTDGTLCSSGVCSGGACTGTKFLQPVSDVIRSLPRSDV
jgi:hypothetical protein